MSDCRFGVSPVNYPDPDPDKVCMFVYVGVLRPSPQRDLQFQRRFFCQQKRLKNDTKTVHKRRFLKRHCHFSKRLGVWPMILQQGLPFKR